MLAAAVLLLLSAAIQFSVVNATVVVRPVRADAEKYVAYAYNLRQDLVFSHQRTWDTKAKPTPDKLTLPGYPAFLALFLEGPPDAAFVHRVTRAQACLGVIATLLTFLIGLRLLPLPWAFAAGVIEATSPHMATISTYLLTESLFTVLVLSAALAILHATREGAGRLAWGIAGIAVGVASLVRPQLQPLPWLCFACACLFRRWRPRLPHVATALACFLAVMGPWYARNAAVPRSDGNPDLLVMTLYHGSFPNMMYEDDPRSYGYPYYFDAESAAHSRDLASVTRYIGQHFAEQPARYANWYLIGKPGFFLSWGFADGVGGVFLYPVMASPFLTQPVFMALRSLNFLLHWPLMLSALAAALVVLWRPASVSGERSRQIGIAVVGALLLYAIAMHMIGAPFSRYGIPFRPLAYVLAMGGAYALARSLRASKSAALTAATPPG